MRLTPALSLWQILYDYCELHQNPFTLSTFHWQGSSPTWLLSTLNCLQGSGSFLKDHGINNSVTCGMPINGKHGSGRPRLRVLLSYGSLQGDLPGSGLCTGTPFATPDGSVNKNIVGDTVNSTSTNGPTICLNYCGTIAGATHYNYCNAAAGCGTASIGACDCKAVAGAPQYYTHSTGTAGDGWISGPAAKANASGGSNFTKPVSGQLEGTTITSYDFGTISSTSDCQKKCAADENCKAYTSCTDLTENYHCDSYNTEICELKTWASGPAVLDGPGDGWYSASRANFT